MSNARALTWSRKWHIISPDRSAAHSGRHLIALCGAYLEDPNQTHYPDHLAEIVSGKRKSAGDCKVCARAAGVRTPEQILAAVRELHQRWATAETWDGRPHMVTRAYALELAVALGIKETA